MKSIDTLADIFLGTAVELIFLFVIDHSVVELTPSIWAAFVAAMILGSWVTTFIIYRFEKRGTNDSED